MDSLSIPLVSVVIPAYKERFLRAAIESVVAQTFRDFELIVVDDASPSDLKTIVDSFRDPRIAYHRNEKNIGGFDLSEAYNHAVSFAKGKYLVLASDDDVYMPTYLERMVELAEAHPEVSLFSCVVGHIDENGVLVDPGVPVLPHETALYYMLMHEFRRRHLTLFEWFMRRASVMAIGGIAKSPLGWFSDVKTMYLLAAYQNGGVIYAQDMLGAFRGSSIQVSTPSKGALPKCEATIAFYEWFDHFLEANGENMVASDIDEVVLRQLKKTYPALAKALLLQLIGYAKGVRTTVKVAKMVSRCRQVSRRSLARALFRKTMPRFVNAAFRP